MPRIEVGADVKLTDPRVSARMNQVMRPLKVLAYLQGDKDLMDDLNMVANLNFEQELERESETFDAMVFRAVVAADEDEEFAKYVQVGKLGKIGHCRYILAKDLATVVNTIMDAENFGDPNQKKKDDGVTSKTVTSYCRDLLRLPTERSGSKGGGVGIVLDREKILAGKFRFGMQSDEGGKPGAEQGELKI